MLAGNDQLAPSTAKPYNSEALLQDLLTEHQIGNVMINFKPRRIFGIWKEGFSLDLHTLSSTYLGADGFGISQFDTKRSEAGELLYRLKNKSDQNSIPTLVEAIVDHIERWSPPIDILVPVPPSTSRRIQPVLVLAEEIGNQLDIPVKKCVVRTRTIPQLKSIFDRDERAKLLKNLHTVDRSMTLGKSVLLFDDLYRSGATMNAIAGELYETGKVSNLFALTVTRTRTHQ